jgi:hypothetical protein
MCDYFTTDSLAYADTHQGWKDFIKKEENVHKVFN